MRPDRKELPRLGQIVAPNLDLDEQQRESAIPCGIGISAGRGDSRVSQCARGVQFAAPYRERRLVQRTLVLRGARGAAAGREDQKSGDEGRATSPKPQRPGS